MQRKLLHLCRETGEYCVEHGLVFPFVQPTLEDPYEPRISELEKCLVIARAHVARNVAAVAAAASITTGTSSAMESTVTEMMTTLEGNEQEEGHAVISEIPLRGGISSSSSPVRRQTMTTERNHVIMVATTNEREGDDTNHDATGDSSSSRTMHIQRILGTHAIPLRMSSARSYE